MMTDNAEFGLKKHHLSIFIFQKTHNFLDIQHLSLSKGNLNSKTRLTLLASLSSCKGQPLS